MVTFGARLGLFRKGLRRGERRGEGRGAAVGGGRGAVGGEGGGEGNWGMGYTFGNLLKTFGPVWDGVEEAGW